MSVTPSTKVAIAFLALAGVPFSLASAKDAPASPPQAYTKLVACKAIADRDARLDCFDKATAALEQAIVSRDVVVTDKAQMKEARRGLFGFALPKLSLFGGDDAADDSSEIEATIKRATKVGRNGPWVIILEDGAKWVQIDGDIFPDPKPGQKIRIRKASLGSYFANVNGQRAVRMKREN